MTGVPDRISVPDGLRVYAIGDIHGCRDALETLHAMIAADADRAEAQRVLLIYLGDYIDRGPDSAAVIDLLLAGPPVAGAERVFLCGNHEQAMLDFMAAPDLARKWLQFGGMETLASYGITRATSAGNWRESLARQLEDKLPDRHRQFFKGLTDWHRSGDYFFVHAGIRPGRRLDRNTSDDFRWIREPFLTDRRWHGARIVHGHTISGTPDVHPNRIGIDTGCYDGGPLTALVLWQNQHSFLQTPADR
jgi:serine/threonine protein phosphatase 1